MKILGVGGFSHDGSVTLLEDNQVIGHVEWERVCRKRFAGIGNVEDLRSLLDATGWDFENIKCIAWADKEASDSPEYQPIMEYLQSRFNVPITVVEHHMCHLASAYYVSGFKESAVVSIDGKGDERSAMIAIGKENSLQIIQEQISASSVGRVWHALAYICGYPHWGDAGKVMALSSFGEPEYFQQMMKWTILKNDGTFSFTCPGEEENVGLTFRNADKMSMYFSDTFKIPHLYDFAIRRAIGPPTTIAHQNLASSVQRWTTEIVSHIVSFAVQSLGTRTLCMAGGVALNVLTNSYLTESGLVDHLFIQPAAGDNGLSLGAALYKNGQRILPKGFFSPYLGRSFTQEDALQAIFQCNNINYKVHKDATDLICKYLREGKVIGFFQGREESGPRALGARSLLANPLIEGMKDRLNALKQRECYRPVALMILKSRKEEYFKGPSCPYMLRCATIKPEWKDLLKEGLHIDKTSRLQIVNSHSPSPIYELLSKVDLPALLNTSLNGKGEPLASTPKDAIDMLQKGLMDKLFIENIEIWIHYK